LKNTNWLYAIAALISLFVLGAATFLFFPNNLNASHELQTPLAIIKGHVELLLNSPQFKEKEIGSLGVILQNTNRLSRLNHALILLSKIEHNRYSDFETIEIKQVIWYKRRNE